MALSASEKGTIFQKLSNLLDQECILYEKYIRIVAEEQQTVTKLSLDRMKLLTEQRESLLTRMNENNVARQQLLSALGENQNCRLSEAVTRHFSKEASFLLLRKIATLRKLVKKSQRLSGELNQLVSFSQRLANGCLAIFASAKNNVFRSYSPFGRIKEAYHPSGSAKSTRRV